MLRPARPMSAAGRRVEIPYVHFHEKADANRNAAVVS
jgi:hypothetical protein